MLLAGEGGAIPSSIWSIMPTMRPISGLVMVSLAPSCSAFWRLSSLIREENITMGISL
ncbi:unknown [Bacillus thuringiensis phage MZTP02]|uniref:Uncharacterized protein n=1 Tax=Bacillus thuringiensis phage MZTP02 TaxID=311221 RepID=Q56AR0_9CAUD|nr:unknown [Bacillus thuringiensis phage MZTP02]